MLQSSERDTIWHEGAESSVLSLFFVCFLFFCGRPLLKENGRRMNEKEQATRNVNRCRDNNNTAVTAPATRSIPFGPVNCYRYRYAYSNSSMPILATQLNLAVSKTRRGQSLLKINNRHTLTSTLCNVTSVCAPRRLPLFQHCTVALACRSSFVCRLSLAYPVHLLSAVQGERSPQLSNNHHSHAKSN